MASSLIGGLLANNYSADNLTACDIDEDRLSTLSQQYSIHTTTQNEEAVATADVVILAVKPQVMQQVCEQLTQSVGTFNCLFISIAAGITEPTINRWLGSNQAIVRCMPNTPALVQLGATGLYANPQVNATQKSSAETILKAVGVTVWIDQEAMLDAVTAVSGSGPAYFFYFIELLQEAGRKLGLSDENARLLANQTALGAVTMAQQGDVVTLREQVTSPGGTTEQAIRSFQREDLASLVDNATTAARDRAVELAQELGKQ